MKIIVQTETGEGRSYQFDIDSSTTVQDLKDKFSEKVNQSEEDLQNMYFTVDSDIVDEETSTLISYGVQEGTRLVVHYAGMQGRNMGALGMRFVDVSNSKGMQSFDFIETAPDWRRVRSGLFLEGTCFSEGCKAYDKDVIMPIGYGKFDMLNDPSDETTKCPMCKGFVEPVNCGFSNCYWRFEGRKQEGRNGKRAPISCSSEWTRVGNSYNYFDPSTTDEVIWKQLVIETVKSKPT